MKFPKVDYLALDYYQLWFKRTDKPTYGISSVRRFLNTWHQVSWTKPPGMKSSRFKLPIDDKELLLSLNKKKQEYLERRKQEFEYKLNHAFYVLTPEDHLFFFFLDRSVVLYNYNFTSLICPLIFNSYGLRYSERTHMTYCNETQKFYDRVIIDFNYSLFPWNKKGREQIIQELQRRGVYD